MLGRCVEEGLAPVVVIGERGHVEARRRRARSRSSPRACRCRPTGRCGRAGRPTGCAGPRPRPAADCSRLRPGRAPLRPHAPEARRRAPAPAPRRSRRRRPRASRRRDPRGPRRTRSANVLRSPRRRCAPASSTASARRARRAGARRAGAAQHDLRRRPGAHHDARRVRDQRAHAVPVAVDGEAEQRVAVAKRSARAPAGPAP